MHRKTQLLEGRALKCNYAKYNGPRAPYTNGNFRGRGDFGGGRGNFRGDFRGGFRGGRFVPAHQSLLHACGEALTPADRAGVAPYVSSEQQQQEHQGCKCHCDFSQKEDLLFSV